LKPLTIYLIFLFSRENEEFRVQYSRLAEFYPFQRLVSAINKLL